MAASVEERCGRNPCWSSHGSARSKLSRACFPRRNLRQVLNSAATLPIMRNVWICRTPGFFSIMKSVMCVQCVFTNP